MGLNDGFRFLQASGSVLFAECLDDPIATAAEARQRHVIAEHVERDFFHPPVVTALSGERKIPVSRGLQTRQRVAAPGMAKA